VIEKGALTIMIDLAPTLVHMTRTKPEAGVAIISKGVQLHKGGLIATKALRIGITIIMTGIIGIMRTGIIRARVATAKIDKGITITNIIRDKGLRAGAKAIEASTITLPNSKQLTNSLSMPSRTPNSSNNSIPHTLPTRAYPS
jgi:hypothetical protein